MTTFAAKELTLATSLAVPVTKSRNKRLAMLITTNGKPPSAIVNGKVANVKAPTTKRTNSGPRVVETRLPVLLIAFVTVVATVVIAVNGTAMKITLVNCFKVFRPALILSKNFLSAQPASGMSARNAMAILIRVGAMMNAGMIAPKASA